MNIYLCVHVGADVHVCVCMCVCRCVSDTTLILLQGAILTTMFANRSKQNLCKSSHTTHTTHHTTHTTHPTLSHTHYTPHTIPHTQHTPHYPTHTTHLTLSHTHYTPHTRPHTQHTPHYTTSHHTQLDHTNYTNEGVYFALPKPLYSYCAVTQPILLQFGIG